MSCTVNNAVAIKDTELKERIWNGVIDAAECTVFFPSGCLGDIFAGQVTARPEAWAFSTRTVDRGFGSRSGHGCVSYLFLICAAKQ